MGTLAHPLNRAEFDAETGKVIAGYTVLQPRTEIKPTSANQSLFTRIFAGDRGIDLYTLAVSDVYQDLFGAASTSAKASTMWTPSSAAWPVACPKMPCSATISLRAFMGASGWSRDILLYEDYPPHYLVNVLRSHRWVRGDWQLLPWLWRRVPAQAGWIRNDLAVIDRWKIVDNLRRSLLAVALMAAFDRRLDRACLDPPGSGRCFAVLTPAIPPLVNTALHSFTASSNASYRAALRPVRDDAHSLVALRGLPAL